MSTLMRKWAIQAVAMLAAACACAQMPFQLDPSFNTPQLAQVRLSSMLPFENGRTMIAGYDVNWAGIIIVSKLLASGAHDPSFSDIPLGHHHLQAWQDLFYSAHYLGVSRFDGNGNPDYTYGAPDSLGGMDYAGDYYLYPDGSIVLAGECYLTDTAQGFVGAGYVLTWLNPLGHLDTAHTPRRGNGNMAALSRRDDGSFLVSGFTPGFGQMVYDGHPVRDIFMVDSLGALDTTFHTTVNYGFATTLLPQPDGKTFACGYFMFDGDPDTMQIVRLMPDGELDTTFNNHLSMLYSSGIGPYTYASAYQLLPIGPDSLIIVGAFNSVDGVAHDCIALIDSTGHLLNEIFPPGSGARSYTDADGIHQEIRRIEPIPSGGYYICGAYHGYSDGANTDNSQWAMSRLYGLNVGIQEQTKPKEGLIQIYPNPATETIALGWDVWLHPSMFMVCDVTGREVMRGALVQGAHQTTVDVRALVSGTYCVRLFSGAQPLAVQRMVIGP